MLASRSNFIQRNNGLWNKRDTSSPFSLFAKKMKKMKKGWNKKEKRMSLCRRKSERQIIRRNDQARRPIEIQFPKGGNA